MATNAQHQASYRARQASTGSVRLDTHISADIHAALTTLAQREGASVRAVVESAIFNEAKGITMQSQFRMDDPALDAGNRHDSKPALATIRLTAEQVAPRKPVSQPATPRKDAAPMTTTTPARPSQMTVAEYQELEQFKTALPTLIINAELDARHVQAHGGAAAMSQKERVTASLLANNIHRK